MVALAAPMGNEDVALLSIRLFTWQDLPVYARLIREAGLAPTSRGRPFTGRDAEEHLRQPSLRPERDCFIAEADGEAAGYALVAPELAIGRAIIEGLVAPQRRRLGIGSRLLEHALGHSAALGARLAHVQTTPEARGAIAFLERAGFAEARRQWQLRLELADLQRGAPASGPAPAVRRLRPGEAALIADLQNRAFGGSWGFAPNTPAEVDYRLRIGGGSYEDALILEVEGMPAAYCWTKLETLDGERVGIIWMIGALPEMRGRGLGRAMLLAGIQALARRGAQAIELTVYADNTPAVELYKATGFRPRGEIVFYEKRLYLPTS